MSGPNPYTKEAIALASQGEIGAALDKLDSAPTRYAGEAMFAKALWQLEGRLISRDTKSARHSLRKSAEFGNVFAARSYSAILAAGIGGARDWKAAVDNLRQWAGRDEIAKRQLALLDAMEISDDGNCHSYWKVDILSEVPYVAKIRGLFTAEECAFLEDMARPRFKPALIFHEAIGKFVRDPVRVSDVASFPFIIEYPAIHALNRRLAHISDTRYRQGEPLQVLRYGPGQQYKPHLDAIPGMPNQRSLTALVYLNDDYAGGNTYFTKLDINVRGETGDGLVFSNALPDGSPDPETIHSGMPVESGTKFLASKWIRMRPPGSVNEGFGPEDAEKKNR